MTLVPVKVGTCHVTFYECVDYATRERYQTALEKAGAEVMDFKFDYATNAVKFYLRLRMPDGHTFEAFTEKLKLSPVWHLCSWSK